MLPNTGLACAQGRAQGRPDRRATAARVLGALLLLSGAACASGHGPQSSTFEPGLEGARARARADSVRYPYTKADIDFMSGMIHHHAQAIVMAKWAPSHGANPAVQRLCERIINAQTDEIGLMSRWLEDRSQLVPTPNPMGMPMEMGGAAHVMPMPGMLSAAQMKELDAARGMDFDRLFLTYMIQHHKGAVTMVHDLYTHRQSGQDEAVFKFASDVEVDQTTEINRMAQMLLTLGGP